MRQRNFCAFERQIVAIKKIANSARKCWLIAAFYLRIRCFLSQNLGPDYLHVGGVETYIAERQPLTRIA